MTHITSETELDITQKQIDQILDKTTPSQDDRDFLNVLGMLVYDYEQKHEPSYLLTGIELLNALMAEENLQPQDLVPPFETENEATAVLKGSQPLTVQQIQTLAKRFNIALSLLL
ncbi:MAG: transcriptional regulator [Cyanobacteria bacterium P01_F01_bin.150]